MKREKDDGNKILDHDGWFSLIFSMKFCSPGSQRCALRLPLYLVVWRPAGPSAAAAPVATSSSVTLVAVAAVAATVTVVVAVSVFVLVLMVGVTSVLPDRRRRGWPAGIPVVPG
jgi:hypothetical protein